MADNLNEVEKISVEAIQQFRDIAIDDFREAKSLAALEAARVKHIGSNGHVTSLMRGLGKLQKEERPEFGKLLNQAKAETVAEFEQKLKELEIQATLPK